MDAGISERDEKISELDDIAHNEKKLVEATAPENIERIEKQL